MLKSPIYAEIFRGSGNLQGKKKLFCVRNTYKDMKNENM